MQDQIEGSLSEHVRIDYRAEARAYGQACLSKRSSEHQGINYHYIMKKTPCPGITHHIFFETEKERKTFEGMLQRCAPTGMICMNGGNQAWAHAVSCLENAKPLFVFDHLGDASSVVVEMLRWRMMSQQERKETFLDQVPDLKLKNCEQVEEEFLKLMSVERASKSEVHLRHPAWSEEMMSAQSSKTKAIVTRAEVFMYNWPERFNAKAVLIIDTMRGQVENLQDKMTKTMAAVYEEAPELGGKKAEREIGWRMRGVLPRSSKRMRASKSEPQR